MTHLMVCVSGFSGVGKDEVCKHLVRKYKAVHTGLVDPAKRHMHELYGFTEQQLFGPSQFRNQGDIRYPKAEFFQLGLKPVISNSGLVATLGSSWSQDYFTTKNPGHHAKEEHQEILHSSIPHFIIKAGNPRFWLSPREALQKYCELMNNLYGDSWVRLGIETHIEIGRLNGLATYSRMKGIERSYYADKKPENLNTITCFSDFRHQNEIEAVRRLNVPEIRPVLIRVRSKRVPNPPYNHKSETEQAQIPDSVFHHVIHNDGSITELQDKIDDIISDYL